MRDSWRGFFGIDSEVVFFGAILKLLRSISRIREYCDRGLQFRNLFRLKELLEI